MSTVHDHQLRTSESPPSRPPRPQCLPRTNSESLLDRHHQLSHQRSSSSSPLQSCESVRVTSRDQRVRQERRRHHEEPGRQHRRRGSDSRRPSNSQPRARRGRPEITILSAQPMADHPAFADGSKGAYVPPEAPPSYEQAMRTAQPQNPTYTDPAIPDHISEVRRVIPQTHIINSNFISVPSYSASVTSQTSPTVSSSNTIVTSESSLVATSRITTTSSETSLRTSVTSQSHPAPARRRNINSNNNLRQRSPRGREQTPRQSNQDTHPDTPVPASTTSDSSPARSPKPALPTKRPSLKPKPRSVAQITHSGQHANTNNSSNRLAGTNQSNNPHLENAESTPTVNLISTQTQLLPPADTSTLSPTPMNAMSSTGPNQNVMSLFDTPTGPSLPPPIFPTSQNGPSGFGMPQNQPQGGSIMAPTLGSGTSTDRYAALKLENVGQSSASMVGSAQSATPTVFQGSSSVTSSSGIVTAPTAAPRGQHSASHSNTIPPSNYQAQTPQSNASYGGILTPQPSSWAQNSSTAAQSAVSNSSKSQAQGQLWGNNVGQGQSIFSGTHNAGNAAVPGQILQPMSAGPMGQGTGPRFSNQQPNSASSFPGMPPSGHSATSGPQPLSRQNIAPPSGQAFKPMPTNNASAAMVGVNTPTANNAPLGPHMTAALQTNTLNASQAAGILQPSHAGLQPQPSLFGGQNVPSNSQQPRQSGVLQPGLLQPSQTGVLQPGTMQLSQAAPQPRSTMSSGPSMLATHQPGGLLQPSQTGVFHPGMLQPSQAAPQPRPATSSGPNTGAIHQSGILQPSQSGVHQSGILQPSRAAPQSLNQPNMATMSQPTAPNNPQIGAILQPRQVGAGQQSQTLSSGGQNMGPMLHPVPSNQLQQPATRPTTLAPSSGQLGQSAASQPVNKQPLLGSQSPVSNAGRKLPPPPRPSSGPNRSPSVKSQPLKTNTSQPAVLSPIKSMFQIKPTMPTSNEPLLLPPGGSSLQSVDLFSVPNAAPTPTHRKISDPPTPKTSTVPNLLDAGPNPKIEPVYAAVVKKQRPSVTKNSDTASSGGTSLLDMLEPSKGDLMSEELGSEVAPPLPTTRPPLEDFEDLLTPDEMNAALAKRGKDPANSDNLFGLGQVGVTESTTPKEEHPYEMGEAPMGIPHVKQSASILPTARNRKSKQGGGAREQPQRPPPLPKTDPKLPAGGVVIYSKPEGERAPSPEATLVRKKSEDSEKFTKKLRRKSMKIKQSTMGLFKTAKTSETESKTPQENGDSAKPLVEKRPSLSKAPPPRPAGPPPPRPANLPNISKPLISNDQPLLLSPTSPTQVSTPSPKPKPPKPPPPKVAPSRPPPVRPTSVANTNQNNAAPYSNPAISSLAPTPKPRSNSKPDPVHPKPPELAHKTDITSHFDAVMSQFKNVAPVNSRQNFVMSETPALDKGGPQQYATLNPTPVERNLLNLVEKPSSDGTVQPNISTTSTSNSGATAQNLLNPIPSERSRSGSTGQRNISTTSASNPAPAERNFLNITANDNSVLMQTPLQPASGLLLQPTPINSTPLLVTSEDQAGQKQLQPNIGDTSSSPTSSGQTFPLMSATSSGPLLRPTVTSVAKDEPVSATMTSGGGNNSESLLLGQMLRPTSTNQVTTTPSSVGAQNSTPELVGANQLNSAKTKEPAASVFDSNFGSNTPLQPQISGPTTITKLMVSSTQNANVKPAPRKTPAPARPAPVRPNVKPARPPPAVPPTKKKSAGNPAPTPRARTNDTKPHTTRGQQSPPQGGAKIPPQGGDVVDGLLREASSVNATAMFDFNGTADDELVFKAGDNITNVTPVNDDWLKGWIGAKCGIFPKAFINIGSDTTAPSAVYPTTWDDDPVGLDEPASMESPEPRTDTPSGDQFFDAKDDFDKPEAVDDESNVESSYGVATTRRTSVALFSFTGQDDSELTFQEGDLINITGEVNEEWLTGKLNGKEGIFPAAYVEEQKAEDEKKEDPKETYHATNISSSVTNPTETSAPLVPADGGFVEPMAVATQDYTAPSSEEISFKTNDTLYLLEQPDAEWFLVQHDGSNAVGRVPVSHVKIVHPLP